jgi:GTPase SAR1 family protein
MVSGWSVDGIREGWRWYQVFSRWYQGSLSTTPLHMDTTKLATKINQSYIYSSSCTYLFIRKMSLIWKAPFTCLVTGPTSCGKTEFTIRLIENSARVIFPNPEKIIWGYGTYQKRFETLKNIEFIEGMPELSMFDERKHTLLILDDLMLDASKDQTITKLFTQISHHMNVSILYLTQNLFQEGKQNRTVSLNSHYMVLFKNPRDASQIACLARQMFPRNSAFMIEAFKNATAKPYSYLFLDLKPETDDQFRLRANIFPDETNYAYIPK